MKRSLCAHNRQMAWRNKSPLGGRRNTSLKRSSLFHPLQCWEERGPLTSLGVNKSRSPCPSTRSRWYAGTPTSEDVTRIISKVNLSTICRIPKWYVSLSQSVQCCRKSAFNHIGRVERLSSCAVFRFVATNHSCCGGQLRGIGLWNEKEEAEETPLRFIYSFTPHMDRILSILVWVWMFVVIHKCCLLWVECAKTIKYANVLIWNGPKSMWLESANLPFSSKSQSRRRLLLWSDRITKAHFSAWEAKSVSKIPQGHDMAL